MKKFLLVSFIFVIFLLMATTAQTPKKLVFAWIPKALNNPVFELGRDGSF